MTFQENISSLSEESRYVLNIIQKNGPITINTLVDHLHMNRGRLQRIMQPLEDSNIIVSSGHKGSTGGRRSVLYDINCKDYFVAGISIGSIRYSIFIVNLKNERIASKQFPRSPQITLEDFIDLAHSQLRQLAKEAAIADSSLLGLGIGIPGAVNREEGVLARQNSDFFHESWINTPMRRKFEDVFGLPAVLDLNIYGETLGHYYYGEGHGSLKLMVVSCSMSIMNGFISKGQLARSMNDHADALAHITVDINGLLCRCGNYGCIDCYSSVQAIINRFATELKLGRFSSLRKNVSDITIYNIISAADSGDPLAASTIEYAARVLGCGLANYIRLLSPDTVILNGIMIDESQLYYDTVVQTAKRQLSYAENHLNIRFIKYAVKGPEVFSEASAALYLEDLFNRNERFIPKLTS